MTETSAKLIRMANQIGAYFAAYPEDEATAGIADHINRFWTRTMRAELVAAARDGAADLSPGVVSALPRIRAA